MKYVYLLRAGQSHYKVGVSTNVSKRVKALQTSNPNKIEVIMTRLVDDAYRAELAAHYYLSEMKADGGREWFIMTPEQALQLAVELNRNPEVDMSVQIKVRDILAKQEQQQKKIETMLELLIDKSQLNQTPAPQIPEQFFKESEKPVVNLDDKLIENAREIIFSEGKASTSLLQRRLQIGYGRAARIMDKLEEQGIVSPLDGIHREILLIDFDV